MTHRPFALGLSMLCMGFHPPLDGALRLSDQRAHERADVQEQRGPAGLVAQGLGAGRLARARRPEQEDAAGPDIGPPHRPQGAGAERLEGLQAAQVGERLAAPVQGQQAALLYTLRGHK